MSLLLLKFWSVFKRWFANSENTLLLRHLKCSFADFNITRPFDCIKRWEIVAIVAYFKIQHLYCKEMHFVRFVYLHVFCYFPKGNTFSELSFNNTSGYYTVESFKKSHACVVVN